MFEGYEPGEVSYVIELLAAMVPQDEITTKFKAFCQKTITVKTIHAITARFNKKIEEKNKAYLGNINGSPMAHMRIHLDILNTIVKDCMQPKFIKSARTDKGYEVNYEPDYSTVLNALKQAHLEVTKREEIDLQKDKNPMLGRSDFPAPELEIEDGLELAVSEV